MRTFVLVGLLFLLSTAIAHADFNADYQTYLTTYDAYRTAHSQYLTTRNQYLQYQTLTSKNDALTGVKNFLTSRDEVLLGHFSLLKTRYTGLIYSQLVDSEMSFLRSHQQEIDSIGSLDDAVDHSQKVEERSLNFKILSRKIVGSVLIDSLENLKNEQAYHEESATVHIQNLKNAGKDTTTLERWLIDAKGKRNLAQLKLDRARSLTDTLTARSDENLASVYSQIQFALFEAHQYLKEARGFMSELVDSIKYGPY